MLRFLRIKHLAVIDAAEAEFGAGLNVLTGETGAGKSILVEAVGLLLGGRASADLVRTGEESAAIEAIFEAGGGELLVRREVTSQGRSRAPGARERRARGAAVHGELCLALRERRGGPRRAGRRMAPRERARRARSAVPAVPRGARRHQVAARGSRRVSPALCRRHRCVA